MKQGLIPLNWTYIGALLANADDTEQAACFNAMAKEMGSWDTRHQAEMQIASVDRHLTPAAKDLLRFSEPN